MAQGQSAVAAPASVGSSWSADPAAMTVASSGAEPPTIRAEAPSTPGPAAQSAIEQPGRFILRADNGDILQEYPLEKPEVSIGRAPNSDILLSKDKLTSRRHATVRYEENKYVLYDERSANGTFVNGQQLEEMTPRVLQDGDHVGIGEHELIFRGVGSSEPSVGVADLPTIAVPYNAPQELTYRTREDELLTAGANDDFSTRTMDNGNASASAESSSSSVTAPEEVPSTPPPAVPTSSLLWPRHNRSHLLMSSLLRAHHHHLHLLACSLPQVARVRRLVHLRPVLLLAVSPVFLSLQFLI